MPAPHPPAAALLGWRPQVLSSDIKASEVEVGIVRQGRRFQVLDDEEVDAHLTAIAERD